MGKIKAQSAVEYVITYSWAILIIGIVVGLLYFYGFISLALRPSGCSINGVFSCEDSMMGVYAHNGTYMAGMLLTNTNQYPISNPTMNASLDGYGSGKVVCGNFVVPAGGTFLCAVKLPVNKLSIGEYVKPTIYLQAGNCALSVAYLANGSCANAPIETFKGAVYGFIRDLPSDNLSISLVPSNANFSANGTEYTVKAHVSLFGYPLKGADVKFASNSSIIHISKTYEATSSAGLAYNYVSSNNSASTEITASYANVSALSYINFRMPQLYFFVSIVSSKVSQINPIVLDRAGVSVNSSAYALGYLNKTGITLMNGTTYRYSIQKSIEVNGTEYIYKNISLCGLSYTSANGSFRTCAQPSIKVFFEPVYRQSGSLYVADEASSQVSIINTSTGNVENVTVGLFPTSIVAGLKHAYTTDLLPDGLSAISEANGTVSNISLKISPPTSIVLSDGNAFVTSVLTKKLYKANLTSGTILGSASTGSLPLSLTLDKNGDVYVADAGSDNVGVYFASNMSFLENISTGLFPEGITTSEHGNYIYVADKFSSKITVINATTNSVQKNISSGLFTTGIAVSPNGAFIYATSFGRDQLWVINATTGNTIEKIPTGIAPYYVVLSPNGAFAYVANLLSDNITAISTINYTVLGSYNVGLLPVSIAYASK